ncbi:hypothetical protein K431DRAFT_305305 [Polychaeton citri CBS 116435]|uniref:Uncharacterized protein n=1 Tax=Polychaeton citri CBS 116435 TaxID=1314669 RepID=A0A9P4Q781_9PEZI|nr:hypothetical protein K431DRAFT_305305 [Polychaeton citri CBS 116435]
MPSLESKGAGAQLLNGNGVIQSKLPTASSPVRGSKIHNALCVIRDDENFKELIHAGVHDHIGQLQHDIASRDKRVDELQANIDKQKASHTEAMQDMLVAFANETTKHNTALEVLKGEITRLQAEAKETDQRCESHKAEVDKVTLDLSNVKDDRARIQSALFDTKKKAAELEKSSKDFKVANTKLKSSLTERDGEVVQLRNEVETLKDRSKSTSEELEITANRLSDIQGMTPPLQQDSLEIIKAKFGSLWSSAFEFVREYFQQDLPESSQQDEILWDKLAKINRKVSIPRSNTLAAKEVRCAMIMAYIFGTIDEEIFQPNDLEELQQLRPMLWDLASQDSRREEFVRSVLLPCLPGNQAKDLKKRVDHIVEDFTALTRGLGKTGQDENIGSDFRKIVDSAHSTWVFIRRLRPYYETSMDLVDDAHGKWETIQFQVTHSGATNDASAAKGGRGKALFVVFPALYRVGEDTSSQKGGDQSASCVVRPGLVLRETQMAEVEREPSQRGPSLPSRRRKESNASREHYFSNRSSQ